MSQMFVDLEGTRKGSFQENQTKRLQCGSAKGSTVRKQRLAVHQNKSLGLPSLNMGGKAASPLGLIPSCCTDNTTFAQLSPVIGGSSS